MLHLEFLTRSIRPNDYAPVTQLAGEENANSLQLNYQDLLSKLSHSVANGNRSRLHVRTYTGASSQYSLL